MPNNINQLSYSFTKNTKLLKQYYGVREKCFRLVRGAPKNYDGSEGMFDLAGEILLVINNDTVVGGARIVGSNSPQVSCLPLEAEGFHLPELFPQLHPSLKTCEIGSLAILPEYRSKARFFKLCDILVQRTLCLGYELIYIMGPMAQLRYYRGVLKQLNSVVLYEINEKFSLTSKAKYGEKEMYAAACLLKSGSWGVFA